MDYALQPSGILSAAVRTSCVSTSWSVLPANVSVNVSTDSGTPANATTPSAAVNYPLHSLAAVVMDSDSDVRSHYFTKLRAVVITQDNYPPGVTMATASTPLPVPINALAPVVVQFSKPVMCAPTLTARCNARAADFVVVQNAIVTVASVTFGNGVAVSTATGGFNTGFFTMLSLTLTPIAAGAISIYVPTNVVVDEAGNVNVVGSRTLWMMYDNVRPRTALYSPIPRT